MMTHLDVEAVVRAVALWEPRGTSIELLFEDRSALREQIALELAPALDINPEFILVLLDDLRVGL